MPPTSTRKQVCALFLASVLIFTIPCGLVTLAADQQYKHVAPEEMEYDLSKQILINTQRISDIKERLDSHIASQESDHIAERLSVTEAIVKTMFSRLDEINWWMRAIAGAIILGLVDRVVGIFPNGVASRRKHRNEAAGESE